MGGASPLMYQLISKPPIPSPPDNPRAFDLRYTPYSGEFYPNEARPVGHLTFPVKTSVSGRKQKDFAST